MRIRGSPGLEAYGGASKRYHTRKLNLDDNASVSSKKEGSELSRSINAPELKKIILDKAPRSTSFHAGKNEGIGNSTTNAGSLVGRRKRCKKFTVQAIPPSMPK